MKVLIADDHKLMLEGVKKALSEAGDFEVVGEAQHGAQVMPLVNRLRPEMVLLDLRMPQMDGLQCLAEIKAKYPATKVVILSQSTDPDVISAALKRGAAAYIVKTIDPADFPAALRQAASGTVFTAIGLPENGKSAVAKEAGLTERELVILDALARGLSNSAIGKELWVAEQTVKFHLTNIYRKLGASNRTEAVRRAYELGLVESPLYDKH